MKASVMTVAEFHSEARVEYLSLFPSEGKGFENLVFWGRVVRDVKHIQKGKRKKFVCSISL